MYIDFYNSCRIFLEQAIQENQNNTELVKAYSNLISKVADIEIKYFEHNTDFNKNHDSNQTEIAKTYHTTQAAIAKTQIEKGAISMPFGQQNV